MTLATVATGVFSKFNANPSAALAAAARPGGALATAASTGRSEVAGRLALRRRRVGVGRRLGKARLQIRPANGVVGVRRVFASEVGCGLQATAEPQHRQRRERAQLNEKPEKANPCPFNTPPNDPPPIPS